MKKKDKKQHLSDAEDIVAPALVGKLKRMFTKIRRGKLLAIALTSIILVLIAVLVFQGLNRRNLNNDIVVGDIPFEFSQEASLKAGEARDAKTLDEGIAIIDGYLNSKKITDNEDLAYLYATKASLQAKKGDMAGGLGSALKAIEANPKDPRYYAQAAEYYGYLDNKEKSKEYYRKALEVYDGGLPEGYTGHSREFFAEKAARQE